MSDWCILRCSGRNTLPLAESLGKAGFEVWTPSAIQRLPRKRAERPAPLLPSYVFARSGALEQLLELSTPDGPLNQHPSFRVFHYLDRIPVIADRDLDALRQSEARRVKRRQYAHRAYSRGDVVQINEGAFAGMSGIVQRSNGKYALVMFGRVPVNVATFLLHPGERKAA